MTLQPIKIDHGRIVEFDDGTRIDVFELARQWAGHFDRLTADRCMAPECDQMPKSGVVTLWGVPIGRLCEGHMPLKAQLPGAWGIRGSGYDAMGNEVPPPCPRCGEPCHPVATPADEFDDTSWVWGHDCEPPLP